MIIPPEEPEQITTRQDLKDDALVDEAAGINLSTPKERLDYSVIKPQAVKIYQTNCKKSDQQSVNAVKFLLLKNSMVFREKTCEYNCRG